MISSGRSVSSGRCANVCAICVCTMILLATVRFCYGGTLVLDLVGLTSAEECVYAKVFLA